MSLTLSQTLTPVRLPEYKGTISVSSSQRYFQDEQGLGFLVIGQNDAVTWPGLVELFDQTSPTATEDYIVDLRAHGITVSRVMMEYAQFERGYLETSPGVFSPAAIRFWDSFIALAERQGLYLLLTPYDTFWQVRNWSLYPYSAAMGGPCNSLHDWLTAPAAIAAQKARWDFIIERWGGSPNIFAWDLMNEIDLYWGGTPAEIDAYITEMATYVREKELAVWGRRHLLTVSSATPIPDSEFGQVIYNHPLLDFATTHLYVGQGTCTPTDGVECADEMISGVRLSMQTLSHPRPYLDSESGPIYEWIKDRAVDREYHHNMSWAHLMAGGAGSGMRWPYTVPHCLLPEFRENLLALARFAATIDWSRFASRNVTQHLRVDRPGIIKTGCSDQKTTALLWLLADSRLPGTISLSGAGVTLVHTLPDGLYCVELWDTQMGVVIEEWAATVSGKKLTLTLPPLESSHRDVALVVRAAG
ncbi:MAG: DUF4038 domain-containing protein [Chloroflexi bacterium]|nr:DUF4038 domain-containing protein [Chloroflexota bacterium]